MGFGWRQHLSRSLIYVAGGGHVFIHVARGSVLVLATNEGNQPCGLVLY